MEKAEIISELKRLAEANGGRAPGRERFARETGIPQSYWEGRYWARWSDLCEEAGLQAGRFRGPGDHDAQMGELAQLLREVGAFPKNAEMRLRRQERREFPDPSVFKKFGKKADQADALARWCAGHDGYDDVAVICRATVTQLERTASGGTADARTREGTVYLLKSGSNYKIGHTTRGSRRRHREIALQLPERPALVHEIATDDALGIERYWHGRFADRRRNGEWFALDREDVAAFKRRKSM